MQTKQSWMRGGLLAVMLGWCVGMQPAEAQYTVLHNFAGGAGDGANPRGSLTLSGSTIYGMTEFGGSGNTGVVFKINTNGAGFSILHNFGSDSGDGARPLGSLTLSGSMLYGAAQYGGSGNYGTLFQLDTNGAGYANLYSFMFSRGDGLLPCGSLTLSGSTLYGTASVGGPNFGGTVFGIYTSGTSYTNLLNFLQPSIGPPGSSCSPHGSLTLSGSTLYGMTESGNLVDGTVFQVDTNGTGYAVLHTFHGSSGDGANPYGSLTLSGSTLYGMTSGGGSSGFGALFKIGANGDGYTVLHNFTGGTADGAYPYDSLTLSGSTLYGLTSGGGSSGFGTLFQIDTSGAGYTISHNFTGGTGDGANPYGSLTLSGSTLYGMTKQGGSNDNGTVFALTLSPLANVSHLNYGQRCYFTYSGNSYYAFIHDYSAGLQESATPGFIGYNTYLTFNAQNPGPGTTIHVAYIYNTNVGRYTQALAVLHQGL